MRIAYLLLLTCVIGLSPTILGAQDNDYTIPEAPEDVDLDLVIARIGDVEITLGDFATRIRYERLRYFYALEGLIGEYGPSLVDLSDPNNQFAPQVRNDLSLLTGIDFPSQLYDFMILEYLYAQEAKVRDIVADECALSNAWAQQLNLGALVDCELPEGFDEAQTEFLETAQMLTGISEDTVEFLLLTHEILNPTMDAIGEEMEIPDLDAVRSRHITVADEETAETVLERIQDGDEFLDLLTEYSTDPAALGNQGDMGLFGRGQMVPEFEEAAFGAEIGQIVGPVASQFGFHVIEVTDQQFTDSVQVRHILVASETEAYQIFALAQGDADFAELASTYSIDSSNAFQGGDLGFIQRGQTVAPFEEAAFGAEVGEIVGPVATDFGFHIIEVTDARSELESVAARHILVETEDEAMDVLERLEEGDDFAELAVELSIDPSAAGHRGDSLAAFTGNTQSGLYSALAAPFEFVPVFGAEVGDAVGPFTYRDEFVVVEILEVGTVQPSEDQIAADRSLYVSRWETEQIDSDLVEKTMFWLQYLPQDPFPSTVFESLAALDSPLADAIAAQEELRAAATIPNTLRSLELPVVPEESNDE